MRYTPLIYFTNTERITPLMIIQVSKLAPYIQTYHMFNHENKISIIKTQHRTLTRPNPNDPSIETTGIQGASLVF